MNKPDTTPDPMVVELLDMAAEALAEAATSLQNAGGPRDLADVHDVLAAVAQICRQAEHLLDPLHIYAHFASIDAARSRTSPFDVTPADLARLALYTSVQAFRDIARRLERTTESFARASEGDTP